MKNLIILISTLFLLLACEKPVIEKVEPGLDLYDQVWETRFHPETFVLHTDPHIYQDLIIAGQISVFEKKLDYNLSAYNKKTGEFLWGWNHPNPNVVVLNLYAWDRFIFIRASNSIFVFDIESKSILWEIERNDKLLNTGSAIFSEGAMFLSVASNLENTELRRSELRKYDLNTGNYIVLYSEYEGQLKPLKPRVGNPLKFTTAEGRHCMVFEIRYTADEISPRESLPDLVCMDAETNETIWRHSDYNEMYSHENAVKYHKGKLYNTGDWSLYSFDPATGEELNRWQFWESYPLGSFNNTDFTIVDDVVYTLDDLGYLNGINTITEDFEFTYKKGAARSTVPPIIRNDLIIYSSLGHQAIEIFDTEQKGFIHKEKDKSFGNKIIYDEETDMYFTTTSEMIHAFRINDQ